uniref:Thiolase N-terminal domain-containing protein n=1 Tax=Neobodo designis TaxID=312471 RepID=A0A7S1M081_NEODS|mmetsp:Transcript_31843/g.98525  ORF Transcript_31843/g.98525 Transcript_31843/m.98525 type:complete len:398 (+) Transcript_31843:45-1238(+)|eukprot:CAMPEP_0174844110 /NCGR_PEP_ID=MMETSP1114-20130205/10908_1 /TAXON_ID=312471 /ORGANISM="Neobodo designis, Strain CCAP 1951/1" /LENGTH=397 /DNA_ID=CAMNT_0016078343 /DNA_START=40 /DNA_END=1233 /DNA_ORIENTATION=+
MSLPKIVISSAVRSPIGAIGGGLADLQARDIAMPVFKAAVEQAKIGTDKVDYTTLGWVMNDPRSPNIARIVSDLNGVPVTSPGTTVMENCASGGAAIHDICRRLLLGEIKVGVAGGVESMSNVPRFLYEARNKGVMYGDMKLVDGLMGGLVDSTVGKKGELMGLLTERLVKKYNVSRETQDEVAFRSHANAIAAWEGGFFDYVLPITIKTRKGDKVVSKDEGPKKLDMAFFQKQKPYFMPEGGTITSANASSLNDGAAMVVLTTEEHAKAAGMPILGEIRAFGNIGVPKEYMGEGAFKIVPKLLEKANMTVEDFDFFEMNEAFAAVAGGALADVKGLKVEKLNQWGSGISLGHPVGATGARQVVDMIHQLGKRGKATGMTSRCVGGGIGSGEIIIRH